jgi:hypothetical protein
MSMVAIPVPPELEHVLKPVLERDPEKVQNGCGPGLRPGSPSCTSNGKPCGSPRHGLLKYWVSAPENSTTCYRPEG